MIYSFGKFELDTQLFELRLSGKPRHVEPQVFNVLVYLLENRDRIIGKPELLDSLWPGRIVSESTLNTCIKAARKVIDDSGRAQSVIATFNRRGYRFVAQVEESPFDPAGIQSSQNTTSGPLVGNTAPSTGTEKETKENAAAAGSLCLDAWSDRPSLSVIPFAYNSGNDPLAWMADVLSEDISIRLARIPGFLVISRNSTFSYKNRESSIQQNGKEEGIEDLRHGIHISPRDNRLAVWGALLASGLLSFNRVEEAIEAAQAACRCDDKIFLPRVVLTIANSLSGAAEAANAAWDDAKRIRPSLRLNQIGWIANPGEIAELRKVGVV